MPRTFTNHAEARKYFDSCRSALARVLGNGDVLVFSPASSSMGHASGNPLTPR